MSDAVQKPGCKAEVMEYFRKNPESGVTSPSQVAIVGDRLFTDVMMANLMGSYGFWIKDGVIARKSFVSRTKQCEDNVTNFSQFARMEDKLSDFLLKRGYCAPNPRSDFE
jgi:phosphatidylglycerophosphatase GEP4